MAARILTLHHTVIRSYNSCLNNSFLYNWLLAKLVLAPTSADTFEQLQPQPHKGLYRLLQYLHCAMAIMQRTGVFQQPQPSQWVHFPHVQRHMFNLRHNMQFHNCICLKHPTPAGLSARAGG